MKSLAVIVASSFFSIACFAGRPEGQKTRDQLGKFYPRQSADFIEQRIRAATSPLKFMRAFVPYYYWILATDPSKYKAYNELRPHLGWCAGDPHHENFGALITPNGNAYFSVTDFDDAGPAPLVADWLRFLTAVTLYQDQKEKLNVDVGVLVDAYRKGLKGEAHAWSSFVKDLLTEAETEGTRPPKKELSADGQSLARDKDSLSDVTAEEKSFVTRALEGKYKIVDALAKRRNKGGSAGLQRFLVLGEDNKGQRDIVELKEIDEPGVAQLKVAPIPAPLDRFTRSWSIAYNGSTPAIYSVVEIDNVPYQIRPEWKGLKGIDSSAYKSSEFSQIIIDEAYALGLFHAKSLAAGADAYKKAVAGLSVNDWKDTVKALAADMRDAFKSL